MDLRKLLSHNNYIIVNKELMHTIGLDETILLSELCNESIYWESKGELNDGFFYSTIENIEEAITFKAKKQKKLLDNLQELGLIELKIKGMPAKRFIKIINEGLSKLIQNDQTSLVKSAKLDWSKVPNKFSQNDQQILITNNNKNNNKNINSNNDRNWVDYSAIKDNIGPSETSEVF